MSTDLRNAREILEDAASWYGYQHEDLSFGLKSPADALKLYLHWTTDGTLPEFCDEPADDGRDMARLRKKILGYDPLGASK